VRTNRRKVRISTQRFTVLDNRVTYRGLVDTYADEFGLLQDIEDSKHAFEQHFLAYYAPGSPESTRAVATANEQTPAATVTNAASRFFQRFQKASRTSTPSSFRPSGWQAAAQAELDRLFVLDPEPYDEAPDPVSWWAKPSNRSKLPNIARMARDVLAIPGELAIGSRSAPAVDSLSFILRRVGCLCRAGLQRRSRYHIAQTCQSETRNHPSTHDCKAHPPSGPCSSRFGSKTQVIEVEMFI
jgi:hypothetical protein